ncbi:hypothetical protein AVEN_76187-1 [Araneus ventricosus]|uniref:Uncharacterized protein n=1 Tax=Araneus ventricosus TaxID=182803 RepID=A0A4Y2EZY8_ARAVE|nr:hypothetical protein AVEN_76187-1 [Araneus ventricosus]
MSTQENRRSITTARVSELVEPSAIGKHCKTSAFLLTFHIYATSFPPVTTERKEITVQDFSAVRGKR